MKLVSWNVNGLRACWGKSLKDFLNGCQADLVCLQETKLQEPFPAIEETGYTAYWSFAKRRGYSGVACLCRHKPDKVLYGVGNGVFDDEGRSITLSFPTFFLVNCYVPNSKGSMERYFFRMDWDVAFRTYIEKLLQEKPVIICGDFNVARNNIDIYPENLLNVEPTAGFLDEERDGMEQLLDLGLLDTFRYCHPDETGAYSWWSNRLNKRDENRGWRIDYFLASSVFGKEITGAGMLPEVGGSDHCPIYLELKHG